MPRQKITLELRGLRTPRERMWAAMRECAGKVFTVSMIEDKAFPLHQTTLQHYFEGLVAAGYIEYVKGQERGRGKYFSAAQFRLLRDVREVPRVDRHGKPSQQGEGVEAMWKMAKVLKRFTWRALADASSQGGLTVAPVTAKSWCRALVASGHFAVSAPSKPGARPDGGCSGDVYRIANDTGPLPPALTKEKCVFDRNTGTLTPIRSPQEVCDAIS